MADTELQFLPVDLDAHKDICIRFRADSFLCSFGSDKCFYEAWGTDRYSYVSWLKHRLLEIPGSCVHVWRNDCIIGQIEMGRFKGDPTLGYVNLYYLVPEHRNRGLGSLLDEYAMRFLAGLGMNRVRLSVSPDNRQAIAFYMKHNWRDLGSRPDHPEVHLMEKEIGGAVMGG